MNSSISNITKAEHVGGYCLRLQFDDGSEQIVDFGSFLQSAQHPDIRSFLAEDKFRSYRVEHGNLIWGDHDLCFPIAELHANAIQSSARATAA